MNKNTNILIIENSSIVIEGLISIFHKSGLIPTLTFAESLDEAEEICLKGKIDLVIINPVLIQNNIKKFNSLKNNFGRIKWLGLIYNYFDQNLLSVFDAIITISDSSETIRSTLTRLNNTDVQHLQTAQADVLSDRETDVLKLLAKGMSNKEIADRLNISINTVISHRKRITEKTGIKSVSGLTIYAVVQKIITID